MPAYFMLQCEACGKTAKEDEAINWLRVEIAGVDATTWSDRPIEGHYCSRECLMSRLKENGE